MTINELSEERIRRQIQTCLLVSLFSVLSRQIWRRSETLGFMSDSI